MVLGQVGLGIQVNQILANKIQHLNANSLVVLAGKTRMGTEIRRLVAQKATNRTDKQKPLWETGALVYCLLL